MYAHELPVQTADDVTRVIRALGKHRYVAGRAHFVHALAVVPGASYDVSAGAAVESELGRWARDVLSDDAIDKASRDERLVRRATEAEVCAVLSAFWDPVTAGAARAALLERIERFGLPREDRPPFGDPDEDEMFPILVDAGWELLPLAELDAERHRGAIEAFGEPISFEAARFEEQEHLPKTVHLQELDALGVAELVEGLGQPPILWLEGNPTYHDYVLRGVLRAAKLG